MSKLEKKKLKLKDKINKFVNTRLNELIQNDFASEKNIEVFRQHIVKNEAKVDFNKLLEIDQELETTMNQIKENESKDTSFHTKKQRSKAFLNFYSKK